MFTLAIDPAALDGTPLFGALALLALLDSLSFGTLLIPLWLLLVPGRVRLGRMLLYLGTIVVFYAAVGVVLMLGASVAFDALRDALETPVAYGVQLVLGVGLFALSFALDSPRAKREGPARAARWRARAMGGEVGAEREATTATAHAVSPADAHVITGPEPSTRTSTHVGPGAGQDPDPSAIAHPGRGGRGRPAADHADAAGAGTAGRQGRPNRAVRGSVAALMGLALTAAALEVATMLPYLAGIGMITAAEPAWDARTALLLGYCLVMVLPAIVLTVLRIVAAPLVAAPLARLEAWLSKSAASTTAWIVGIVGVLLALDALRTLGPLIGT